MRKELKELDIKITELADYLGISRPTMYKYIDSFESKSSESIPHTIISLFEYIKGSKIINKRNVINYILNNVKLRGDSELSPEELLIESFSKFIKIHGVQSEKVKFISIVISESKFDSEITTLLAEKPHSIRTAKAKNSNLVQNASKLKSINKKGGHKDV